MTAVERYTSEHGWMDVASRDPHPALAPHVRRYWGVVERTTQPMRRRELPSQDVVAILGFGSLRVDDAERTSFVAGLTGSSVVTEHAGAWYGIDVTFTPLGAWMILGAPMHLLANQVVPFQDVWGAGAGELLERLYEAPGWDDRFDLLDRVFAERLRRAITPPPAVTHAWGRLVATDGRVGVGELTAELGCSRRYLSAQFREHVGLAPKLTARILRFQRAIRLLDLDGRRLERVAYDCGYYDQAHFNRDFRAFAGSTPTEFLERLAPAAPGLAAD